MPTHYPLLSAESPLASQEERKYEGCSKVEEFFVYFGGSFKFLFANTKHAMHIKTDVPENRIKAIRARNNMKVEKDPRYVKEIYWKRIQQ